MIHSRYHDVHEYEVLGGPGDARPTAMQIVKDEGLEGKLTDKVFLITGTSSGIGIETARAVAATGAKVFCAVRNLKKAQDALHDILEPGRVELLELDMNSLDSVRAAAKEFNEKSKTLDVLICNAGIMATPEGTKTADGFEAQFGTCHLAHFLLFQLVKPALLASATPEFGSRVVMLSSSGHTRCGPNFGDYNYTKGGYEPWAAYAQAKTSNIYMANEIERLYGSKNLHGLSVHPGGIFTGLQKHVDESIMDFWKKPEVAKAFKSTEQGAATTLYAALSKDWEGKGGRFLEDCEEAEPAPPSDGTIRSKSGYAPHAYNPEGEKQLWEDSLKLVGLEGEQ